MRRVPWSIRLISVLWVALLLGSSLLWPQGLGYDEITHVDMAQTYRDHPTTFHGPGELMLSEAGRGMQAQMGGVPPRTPLVEQEPAPRGERPAFDAFGAKFANSRQPNQMVQHPPLAYWVYAGVLSVPGVDSLAWDAQVWLLRLLGVLLVLPVPLLCWATARRLLRIEGELDRRGERLALAAAVVPLTMPNLARVGASVTNDALLIGACSLLVYLLVRVMTGDFRRRTGVLVGVLLAVALWTKAQALVLPPLVLVAYLIGTRRWHLAGARASFAAATIGGVVGGVWWLRNLVVHHTVQVNGYGERFMLEHWGVRGDADDGRLSQFVGPFTGWFVERIWGGIGLADSLTPGHAITFGWFALAACGVVAAVVARPRRPTVPSPGLRRVGLALLLAVVLTVGLVAWSSLQSWYRRDIGPAGAQGRYIYHLVVGLAALVAVGWGRLLQRRHWNALPVLLLVGALVTNVLAWSVVLKGWYGADRSVASGWDGLLLWSPVPAPVTVVVVGVVPVVASVAALGALVARRRPASAGS